MARSSRRTTIARNSVILAKHAHRGMDYTGTHLFKWASKGNPSYTSALNSIPKHFGFLEWLMWAIIFFLIHIAGALLSAFLMYLLIGYGIPWFLFGSSPFE